MSLNSTIRIPQVTGTLAYVDLYEIVQDLEGASSPVYRAKKIGSRFGDVVVRPLPPGLEAAEDLFRQMREGFQRIGALATRIRFTYLDVKSHSLLRCFRNITANPLASNASPSLSRKAIRTCSN